MTTVLWVLVGVVSTNVNQTMVPIVLGKYTTERACYRRIAQGHGRILVGPDVKGTGISCVKVRKVMSFERNE